MSTPDLLTTAQVSGLTGLTVDQLKQQRARGTSNIPYVRLGPKTIRYRAADVDAWLRLNSGKTYR